MSLQDMLAECEDVSNTKLESEHQREVKLQPSSLPTAAVLRLLMRTSHAMEPAV